MKSISTPLLHAMIVPVWCGAEHGWCPSLSLWKTYSVGKGLMT